MRVPSFDAHKRFSDAGGIVNEILRSRIKADQRIKSLAFQPRALVHKKIEWIQNDDTSQRGPMPSCDRRSLTFGIDHQDRTLEVDKVRHNQTHTLPTPGRPNGQDMSRARISDLWARLTRF